MPTEAEFWNEAGGLAWVAGQELLDAQLAPIGELATDAAAVRPGEAVLDVGCGCGATTAELARRVGPAGRVVGVDVSTPMLGRARERLALPNVELVLGDASSVELAPKSFDVLYSRFGVMFFEDPVRAFAHLRSAMKPGGRMSLVVWQPVPVNAWVTVPAEAVAGLVEPLVFGGPDQPGPFSMAEPDRLRSILGRSGWAQVDLVGKATELLVGGGLSLPAAVAFTMDYSPLRRVLSSAPPPVRAAAAERLAEALAPYTTPSGVRLAAAVWIVTARVSAARR